MASSFSIATMIRRVTLASLILVGFGVAYFAVRGPSAEKVRGKVFRALGTSMPWDEPIVLRELTGKRREFLVFDGAGRFVHRTEFGSDRVLVSAVGHDGTETWERNRNGECRRLARGEVERLLLYHWMLSGFWCDPKAPVSVESNWEESGNGRIALDVEYRDAPFTRGTLLVNCKTWLPHSFLIRDFGFDYGFSFDAFQQCRGKTIVRRLRYEDSVAVDVFGIVEEAAAEIVDFRRPQDESQLDYDYSQANELITRSFGSKLYVRPKVNGEELGWFLFDSGAAGSMLSSEAAVPLRLPQIGRVLSRGVGTGWHYGTLHLAESFQLGIVQMASTVLQVSTLPIGSIGKHEPVVGVVGADVMSHCVVEYDLRNVRVSLYDPFLYELPFGEWQSLTDYEISPHIRADFDGHPGHFTVDTGAPGGLFLNPLTVEKLGLLEYNQAAYDPAGGFGGGLVAYSGKLRSLNLGGLEMNDIPTVFGGDVDSGIADRFCDGLIGADILNRFRVVFDLGRGRIAFLDH